MLTIIALHNAEVNWNDNRLDIVLIRLDHDLVLLDLAENDNLKNPVIKEYHLPLNEFKFFVQKILSFDRVVFNVFPVSHAPIGRLELCNVLNIPFGIFYWLSLCGLV